MGAQPSCPAPSAQPPNQYMAVYRYQTDAIQFVWQSSQLLAMLREKFAFWPIQRELEQGAAHRIKFRGNPHLSYVRIKHAPSALIVWLNAYKSLRLAGLCVEGPVQFNVDSRFLGAAWLCRPEPQLADGTRAAYGTGETCVIGTHLNDGFCFVSMPDQLQQDIHAVVDAQWKVTKCVNDNGGYYLKMKGYPWCAQGTQTMAMRHMVMTVLYAMRVRGWHLDSVGQSMGCSEMSTMYFQQRPQLQQQLAEGPASDKAMWSLSLHQMDRIRVMPLHGVDGAIDAAEWQQLSGMIARLITQYGHVVTSERAYGEGSANAHEFKLKGHPWNASGEACVESRRMVMGLLEHIFAAGWMLHATADLSTKVTDASTFFFVRRRRNDVHDQDAASSVLSVDYSGNATVTAPFVGVSLNHCDKLRLLRSAGWQSPHVSDGERRENDDIQRMVQRVLQESGILKTERAYGLSHEFAFHGMPWWRVREFHSITIVTAIVNGMRSLGWRLYTCMDVSQKTRTSNDNTYPLDLSTMLFVPLATKGGPGVYYPPPPAYVDPSAAAMQVAEPVMKADI